MDKRILIAFAFMLVLGSCFASGITRSLSSTTVEPGQDLIVTLTVTVTGDETFYAIDELVPQGWTVKDAGTGSAEHAGHIKWIVIENAQDTTYTYVLTAPMEESTATISGMYQFEGMAAEGTISGEAGIIVAEDIITPPPEPKPTDYTLIIVGVVVAIIAIGAYVLYTNKK